MRAVIDDFFSDRYAERARQEHAYTSGMSHLGRPLGMWCRLHYNPKETGGCIESFHVKWAKELGTSLKSEAFVRDMVAREIKTSAACSEAIRALQDSRDILPDPAEVSACQGQLWGMGADAQRSGGVLHPEWRLTKELGRAYPDGLPQLRPGHRSQEPRAVAADNNKAPSPALD